MGEFERRRRRTRRTRIKPPGPAQPTSPAAPVPTGCDEHAAEPVTRRPSRPVPEPPPRHTEPTSPAARPDRYDRPERTERPLPRWERNGNGFHGEDTDNERGLRGLVGAGPSQVGVSAAMRARDAARPTADDLAAAEAELNIVRRYWTPRE